MSEKVNDKDNFVALLGVLAGAGLEYGLLELVNHAEWFRTLSLIASVVIPLLAVGAGTVRRNSGNKESFTTNLLIGTLGLGAMVAVLATR